MWWQHKQHTMKRQKRNSRKHGRGGTVWVFKGVANMKGESSTQPRAFAPYLADERIMALTNALFGPYVRISCTDCVINYPGNERGYWHSDWPYNQTNATHIPAPYPDTIMHLSTIWDANSVWSRNGWHLYHPRKP